MTKEDLRTKYERIHFTESDTPRGKLKQDYAKWLEKELIKQLTIPVVGLQSEQLPMGFITWYSGMEETKIKSAYERWLKECGN